MSSPKPVAATPDLLERADIDKVVEMISDGSGPGIVKLHLKKKGLTPNEVKVIIEYAQEEAQANVNRRSGWKMALGIAMVVGGIVMIRVDGAGLLSAYRISRLILLVLGVITFGKGLVEYLAGIQKQR